MKNKNFILIFLLFVFFLPVISSADLKPAYSFADGNGRAWAIEEGRDKKPDIGIDENGQAWAICNGGIYRANQEGLIEISHSETGIPSQFAKSPSGQLYILWKNEYGITITKFLKGKIKKAASLQLQEHKRKRKEIYFYVDSSERFWITGRFPAIYLWSDNKWISHEIKPEQFVLRDYDREKKWKDVSFSPIYPKELSKKTLIFYSKWTRNVYLDGFIAFSDGKFRYLRGISSLPRSRITALEKMSDGFLLSVMGQSCCAVDKVGIFKVDAELKSASYIVPVNHALRKLLILKIIIGKKKKTWFLSYDEENKYSVSLWQLKDDNIECKIKNLETMVVKSPYEKDCYPLLVNKKGDIWLGTIRSGLWIKLRESDIWQHVDWQSGFPLHSVKRIKEDKVGNIWFCGYNSGLCCLSSKIKISKDASLLNWKAIPIMRRRSKEEFDSNGNLWTILNKDTIARFSIEKEDWSHFSLKKDSRADVLAHDDKGSIWIFSWRNNCDWYAAMLKEEKIRYFFSRQAACEFIAKKRRDCIVSSDSKGFRDLKYMLSIKNGKACFISEQWKGLLNYFDGKNWKLWRIKDIDPSVRNCGWNEAPFFDSEGMLRINIQENSWLWNGKQWKAKAYLEGPIKRKERLRSLKHNKQNEARNKLNQLERFSVDKITNIFETDDGMIWAKNRFSLYKLVDTLCVEMDAGKHPLMENKIKSSRIDKNGNLYIKTPNGWFVRSADRGHSPETLIETKNVFTDKFPISFSFSGRDNKTVQKKLRFSWSLDDEKWSSPSYDKVVSFDWLSNGEYVLKVKALDEELNYDLTPAVIRFTVNIDPKKLLADNLKMLKSSDYNEREKAIRNLVHIGKEALSELKKLRGNSKDDDLRWWIDVVIQQIEAGK